MITYQLQNIKIPKVVRWILSFRERMKPLFRHRKGNLNEYWKAEKEMLRIDGKCEEQ